MKYLILILFAMFSLSIFAQECDCKEAFSWVKNTFEKNDAGFQYIVDKKGAQSYNLHNEIYTEKVSKINNPASCEKTIRGWLSFFRKAHLEFHYTGKVDAKEHTQEKESEKTIISELSNEVKNTAKYKLHTRFVNATSPFIEQLNQNTLYLRVPSFESAQKQKIDSIISENLARIVSTKNLIIDIRNGTGGNDDSYQELLPFLYTNPIRSPGVVFLSTPLNNKRMLDFATNTGLAIQFGLNSSIEERAKFQANYETLSNNLGSFVNLKDSDLSIKKLDTIYPFPKNIGVLINHNNVSTDEQFLLEAKQSKKVKLFGTTTKGGLDISNLSLTFSPNKEFVLVYGLSKSLRIPHMIIDDIGIMPDFFIDDNIPEYDWIDFANSILNEQD